MQYQIIETSKYAQSILKSCSFAAVHSVYRKTVNISCGQMLLSIQASGTVLSPVSLIIGLSEEDIQRLSIRVGDSVVLTAQGVNIISNTSDSIVFHLDEEACQIKDLKFSDSQKYSAGSLVSMLKSALANAHTGGFEMLFSSCAAANNQPVLIAAKRHLEAVSAALYRDDWYTAAEELCSLIGLGSGLTPGGDDFICGVLAGINLLNASNHPFSAVLKEQVRLHVGDTNDISRTFLLCALSNEFSLPVNEISSFHSPEELLAAFKKIGHSSGVDTLCGIYYICSHFLT